jgi:hypothetical protein
MNRVLLLMLLFIVFIYLTGFQEDRYITETVHNRLKFSLNRAAHDAALQVDKEALSEGQVVFSRGEALDVFKATLRDNLQLQIDLSPIPGSLFQSELEVIFEDYVDDDSGVAFPLTYTNAANQIVQVLKGPAVVYRVRVKLPRSNSLSYQGYIYKSVIYEYPFY